MDEVEYISTSGLVNGVVNFFAARNFLLLAVLTDVSIVPDAVQQPGNH